MKRAEFIKFCGDLLKKLHENGILLTDYEYLDMFDDYMSMVDDGYKKTYIVAVLAKRYNMCERKVYKVLRHFEEEC